MVAGENSTEELRIQHQVLKSASIESGIEGVDSILPSDLLQSVNQLREKGASSWLTAVPPVHQGLVWNKQNLLISFLGKVCLNDSTLEAR